MDEKLNGEINLNYFKFYPFFEKTEEEWNEIKEEILGKENVLNLQSKQLIEEEIKQMEA